MASHARIASAGAGHDSHGMNHIKKACQFPCKLSHIFHHINVLNITTDQGFVTLKLHIIQRWWTLSCAPPVYKFRQWKYIIQQIDWVLMVGLARLEYHLPILFNKFDILLCTQNEVFFEWENLSLKHSLRLLPTFVLFYSLESLLVLLLQSVCCDLNFTIFSPLLFCSPRSYSIRKTKKPKPRGYFWILPFYLENPETRMSRNWNFLSSLNCSLHYLR